MTVEPLWTEEECAEYLQIAHITLKTWRYQGQGPPYLSLGTRKIRYNQQQVMEWLLQKQEKVKQCMSSPVT